VKYKTLKSAAHNFGNSFASPLNFAAGDYIMSHLARRAIASGQTEMSVDILTGVAGPPELVGSPVGDSIEDRRSWFPSLLASQRIDPTVVRDARMRIVFDTARRTTSGPVEDFAVCDVPFDCWVTLLDDRGRAHGPHFRRWWAFSVDGAGLSPPRPPSLWRRLLASVRGVDDPAYSQGPPRSPAFKFTFGG
jgi:hypothetical protein